MDFQADHFGGMRIRHQEFSMRVEPRSDASSLETIVCGETAGGRFFIWRRGAELFCGMGIYGMVLSGRRNGCIWEYYHISGRRSKWSGNATRRSSRIWRSSYIQASRRSYITVWRISCILRSIISSHADLAADSQEDGDRDTSRRYDREGVVHRPWKRCDHRRDGKARR